jgi:hypothetical protein
LSGEESVFVGNIPVKKAIRRAAVECEMCGRNGAVGLLIAPVYDQYPQYCSLE